MKKKVVIDVRDLDNLLCGFGQQAYNYVQRFGKLNDPQIEYSFLEPKRFEWTFDIPADHSKKISHFKEVDLWHCTNQLLIKRGRAKSRKYILTIHDLNFLFEKGWLSRMKNLLRIQYAIWRADAVTTISGYVGRQIEEHFHLGNKKVEVIYNGVEQIVDLPSEQPSFATGRKFFFAIGQIRKKKNFHLLIEMMKRFPDYDLYICGDDHFKDANPLRERIQQEGISNVFLTGPIQQTEKIWLYRHCEALLFPSMGEGFGIPVIEAMQFGKPVFVSNCTCLPEIVGDCAIIWNNLIPENMADTIQEFLPKIQNDANWADKVRQHATQFTYEHYTDNYRQLYQRVLSE